MTEKIVTGIKAFGADLSCLAHQFEVGKTYSVSGGIKACKHGFHAIPDDQHPLSVFEFYPPSSRFCIVEQSGDMDRSGTKLASAMISVRLEISLSDLILRAAKWVFDRATPEGPATTSDNGLASATGVQGAASATGYQGAASATGVQGAASATGYQGAASATGYQGAATASGYRGAASATGVQGAASATGDWGAATATGYQGAASATGYQGAASATGTRGAATASGVQGAATASGYRGAATATGDCGAATASGVQGAATATGAHCVAISTGIGGRACVTATNAMCLVNRDPDTGAIRHIRAAKAGDQGIKIGVFYTLDEYGEFVEAE